MSRLIATILTVSTALCSVGTTLPPRDSARLAEIAASLPEHPGLVGLRPEDRPRWREPRLQATARRTIGTAERFLAAPVPEMTDDVYLKCLRHGDANIQPKEYWKRHYNLMTLAFAEAFESKGRFLPKMAEYLEAYCDEKSWLFAVHDKGAKVFFGKEPPRIDLCVAHRAELLGTVLALHKKDLPAKTCERTMAAL